MTRDNDPGFRGSISVVKGVLRRKGKRDGTLGQLQNRVAPQCRSIIGVGGEGKDECPRNNLTLVLHQGAVGVASYPG